MPRWDSESVRDRRFWVMVCIARRCLNADPPEPLPNPQHIWYPRPDLDYYELRDGNAPSDTDRPAHLVGLDLWIDCPRLGKDLLAQLGPGGKINQVIKERHGLDIDGRRKVANAARGLIDVVDSSRLILPGEAGFRIH